MRREPPGGSWDLTVRGHFDAAHALRGYEGECRELHGHTWDVEATVRGEALDDIGIVYDFKTLKDDLAAVLDPFDHAYLNDVPPFDGLNATAENLARVIFEALQARVAPTVTVTEVAVWESPVARIAYRKA
ncbi:MAG: 6-carboxytetrahydropterin synthase QueD [Coriobacteriia bacterium]|nr:6-carboxytetrahydropterin synthase QueD [Coriobacteriia bacterium]